MEAIQIDLDHQIRLLEISREMGRISASAVVMKLIDGWGNTSEVVEEILTSDLVRTSRNPPAKQSPSWDRLDSKCLKVSEKRDDKES